MRKNLVNKSLSLGIQNKTSEKNYYFRSFELHCFVDKLIAEKQFAYIDKNYMLFKSQKTLQVYELHIVVDSDSVDKLLEIIDGQSIKQQHHIFREHTQSQVHNEYQIMNKTVFTAEHWPGTYVIVNNHTNFTLLIKDVSFFDERYAMYIIREIIIKTAEKENLLLLHAASLDIDGKTVLLAGDKGAGKTTMLCHLCANIKNTAPMSNDRTYIEDTGKELIAHYFPLKYRISMDTVRLYDRMKNLLYMKYITYKPNKAKALMDGTGNSKLSLLQEEFEHVFYKKGTAFGKLNALFFLDLHLNSNILKYKKASEEEIVELLNRNNLSYKDDLFIDDWIIKSNNLSVEEKRHEKTIQNIASKIKCYRIDYGSNITGEELGSFIKDLLKE